MTNCINSGTSDSFGTAVTQLHYENAGKDVRMSTTYVIHARGLNTPLSPCPGEPICCIIQHCPEGLTQRMRVCVCVGVGHCDFYLGGSDIRRPVRLACVCVHQAARMTREYACGYTFS